MKKSLIGALLLCGCSGVQIAVDPLSIRDRAKYEQDMSECRKVAESYDNTGTAALTGVGAGLAGGAAVGGVALAVAGGIFPPAIPFIIAGTLAAGATGGGIMKGRETAAREKILIACMNDRGYKAYSGR